MTPIEKAVKQLIGAVEQNCMQGDYRSAEIEAAKIIKRVLSEEAPYHDDWGSDWGMGYNDCRRILGLED